MENVWDIRSKKFLPRKAWIPTKRINVETKDINTIPVKWIFKSKEKSDVLILSKSGNIVKGLMQVPGIDFTESLYPGVLDSSTRTLIGMTLYYEDNVWIANLCDI